jgi:hypothetical protein
LRRATAALLGGSLLAVGIPTGWYALAERDPEPYGTAVVEQLGAPAAAAAPQGIGTASARLADLVLPADPRADPPAELRFAGLVVPVDAVGLDAQRQVVVPPDVRRAGWYEPGVAPGRSGRVGRPGRARRRPRAGARRLRRGARAGCG